MEDAWEIAIKLNLPLKEVSAKTGEGVKESLDMVIDWIIEAKKEDEKWR